MVWLTSLQHYIATLDKKRLTQYLGAIIGVILVIMLLLIINYYRAVSRLKTEIEQVNETREHIKKLLDEAQHVKAEQKEIDAILAKDPNFKIVGYFEDLLAKLHLSNKKASKLDLTSPVREGKYQEIVLKTNFTDMNMQELTQLLQELEQNKRVFSKELEITASRKNPNSIDVSLTIAALEPKGLEPEIGE